MGFSSRGYGTLLKRRLELWDKEQKRQQQLMEETQTEPVEMTISMLGQIRTAVANQSRPLELARKYNQRYAKKYAVAIVNDNTLWDMQRPLPPDTKKLNFLRYDKATDPVANSVYWHSAAHVMGAILEKIYGDNVLLCDGPALAEGGFFYEFLLLDPKHTATIDRLDRTTPYTERINQLCGASVPQEQICYLKTRDLKAIEAKARKFAQGKHVFKRMDVTFDFAWELFLDNPFKLHFIDRIRKGQIRSEDGSADTVSLYRCGDMIDLCRGPHMVHTSNFPTFLIDRVSSAHWVGHLDSSNATSADSEQKSPVLNRVYGIAFPKTEMLEQHKKLKADAARRDHRNIGKEQRLFMMHPWAPGSGFILPHGLRMVNTIMAAIRRKYAKYGFDEVSTPLMFNRQLWETSGHWENYRDDMFTISADMLAESKGCCDHHRSEDSAENSDAAVFGLKPMNCPGHCLIFASDQRSYKDLPIRYADFSPLHRNEIAGALSGLTRVRKFHQDDGHIFCTREQVAKEIKSCLKLIDEIYAVFGFPAYELALSTRPKKFIGDISEWDEAESALKEALSETGRPWTLNEGDGAFYGPKIDVRVHDALRRQHQTATIQLDFQLPQRFDLKYAGPDGKWHQPVMIHRAVLGSMERMLAILIEHWGGKWPFWINPRQAIVIPTTTAASAKHIVDYAKNVRQVLASDKHPESVDSHRFFVDIDLAGNTLSHSVRDAQLAQYSYILVVGENELKDKTIDVRKRNGTRVGPKSIEEVKAMFQTLVENYQ
ncbi:hypothetical protein H4R22_002821 [Coemansia sp. RSA 1290]|nr:hypothetical protein H4R22_002821 [Coemansia sp. RSA 1290]KAJ2653719.1 hypothetical protein IWW40_000003 [Coemansia sp. RSA 1250]KAJ2676871.1 hypothetical protein IWW42_000209 [Coemansia sp. RSA 1085]